MMSVFFNSMALLLLIIIILIVAFVEAASISPSNDTHLSASTYGFQSNIRRLNKNQLTKIELLQIAAKGDKERLRKIVEAKTGSLAESWSTHGVTIASHIQQSIGGFIMNLSIGTPKQSSFSAIIDTGSDLIWTKCKKPSFNQSRKLVFDPERSSSYSKLKCNSDMCKAFPSNLSSCGKHGECMYKYGYGDNTSTRGVLATETFTFNDANVSVPNLDFGCGFDNKGPYIEELAGVMGLGRGNLSLVSQMKDPRFSYCLPTFGTNEIGRLFVGSLPATLRGAKTTRLENNPFMSNFYYLSLQGITIGDTRLKINKTKLEINRIDGTGGLFIDSGTTLTYLEKSSFNQVTKELARQIDLPSFDGKSDIGLELCFNITCPEITFPNFTFHFRGANFELIPDNYFAFVDDNHTVRCLVMGSSPFSVSIFGNFQQQNALVGYDLGKNKLSFNTNTNCAN